MSDYSPFSLLKEHTEKNGGSFNSDILFYIMLNSLIANSLIA